MALCVKCSFTVAALGIWDNIHCNVYYRFRWPTYVYNAYNEYQYYYAFDELSLGTLTTYMLCGWLTHIHHTVEQQLRAQHWINFIPPSDRICDLSLSLICRLMTVFRYFSGISSTQNMRFDPMKPNVDVVDYNTTTSNRKKTKKNRRQSNGRNKRKKKLSKGTSGGVTETGPEWNTCVYCGYI